MNTSSNTSSIYKKIVEIQKEMGALEADGEMEINDVKVAYPTKHNIVGTIVPLMNEKGLYLDYREIVKMEPVCQYDTFKGRKQIKVPITQWRIWVKFAIVDTETGEEKVRLMPGEAEDRGAKAVTVATAFALRDFLSLVFQVHIRNGVSPEEAARLPTTATVAAETLDMAAIHDMMKIKATHIMKKVTLTRLKKEAAKRDWAPSSWNLHEMKTQDFWEIIELGLDIISPDSEKEGLKKLTEGR